MEDNNLEGHLIGSFLFYDENYIMKNLSNNDLSKLQGFSIETIKKSACVDSDLQNFETIYFLVKDYIYNIFLPDQEGHKIFIRRSSVDEHMINVYSLNFQEVISDKGILRRVKGRNWG